MLSSSWRDIVELGVNCLRGGRELAVLSLDDARVLARDCAWPRRMAVPG